jgi:multiple sugar transport system ATP-binding protein
VSAIEIRGIAKTFGEVVAVHDLDLDLASGENLVVLGPSGSGKSTLLRILAGLEPPDRGEILVGGVPQQDLPPHKRDVAIVFQHFALYPHLSALDNITLGLRHGLGLPKAEARARAHDVAERLAITDLLGRLPRQMSGGQRQRVALGRALARRSGVVLLDEPLSGLDAQLRLVLRAEIGAVLRETGATTVHVTHDQTDAMAMADRVAVLRGGVVEQLGTPEDLYRRPASTFVATFVGSPPMTMLTASDAVFGPVSGLPEGATLGLRPEHLLLDGGAWRTRARVRLVEHEGPSCVLHLETSTAAGSVALRARTGPEVGVAVGDEVTVGVEPSTVHVFAADGFRLGSAAELGLRAEAQPTIGTGSLAAAG